MERNTKFKICETCKKDFYIEYVGSWSYKSSKAFFCCYDCYNKYKNNTRQYNVVASKRNK